MLLINGEIVSCAMDYITLTNVHTSTKTMSNVLKELYDRVSSHTMPKAASWGGYAGWSNGPVRWGTRGRDGGVDEMFMVSGHTAHSVLAHLTPNSGPFRTTRIDVQATIRLAQPNPGLARVYYDNMKLDDGYRRTMIGKRKITLIDSQDGTTLYIGSRTTRSFIARLYDRSREYEWARPGEVWRLEVEFKRDLAGGILKGLVSAEGKTSHCKQIVSQVAEEKLGILTDMQEIPLEAAVKDAMQNQNQLDWLKKCVRPVVDRECQLGRVNEVIEALGLRWVIEHSSIDDDISMGVHPLRGIISASIGSI
jgi:hypothetical protein